MSLVLFLVQAVALLVIGFIMGRWGWPWAFPGKPGVMFDRGGGKGRLKDFKRELEQCEGQVTGLAHSVDRLLSISESLEQELQSQPRRRHPWPAQAVKGPQGAQADYASSSPGYPQPPVEHGQGGGGMQGDRPIGQPPGRRQSGTVSAGGGTAHRHQPSHSSPSSHMQADTTRAQTGAGQAGYWQDRPGPEGASRPGQAADPGPVAESHGSQRGQATGGPQEGAGARASTEKPLSLTENSAGVVQWWSQLEEAEDAEEVGRLFRESFGPGAQIEFIRPQGPQTKWMFAAVYGPGEQQALLVPRPGAGWDPAQHGEYYTLEGDTGNVPGRMVPHGRHSTFPRVVKQGGKWLLLGDKGKLGGYKGR